MNRRDILIGSSALLATMPLRAARADNLIPLQVGYDGYSMTTAPMYYATQTGVFPKHGLDVSLIYVQGGSTLSQAGVGGSVNISQNGYSPAIAATVQGGDLVIIGGISNTLPFQLVTTAKIKTVADLKGAKIAISKYGSSTDIAADFALAHLGLTRNDVTILQLGGEGSRTAAIMSGQIDGSFEQYPRTAQLVQQGFNVLLDLTTTDVDYPNTAYVTTRGYLKDNRDIVKKFLLSITQGIHDYKVNPDKAIALTGKFLKIDDLGVIKQAYDLYNARVFPNIPYPSIKGVNLVLKQLAKKNPAAASMTADDVVDTSPLKELEQEGALKDYM